MKSILISIRPKWVAKILKREKTIEIRKTAPKCDLLIDVYIYCTNGDYIGHLSKRYVGKVVAKFTLRKVEPVFRLDLYDKSCLSPAEIFRYANGRRVYAWHISDLVIFDKPKELGEFGLEKAPQSWCYVEEK